MSIQIQDVPSTESSIELQIFNSFEQVRNRFPKSRQSFLDWEVRLAKSEISVCCAIIDDIPVGRLWWITDAVPPDLNTDGPCFTSLPLALPRDAAFVFDVWVKKELRGNRLYAAMLSYTRNYLIQQGTVTKFLITVEFGNRPAIRAAERIGFKEIGYSSLFRISNVTFARYPDAKVFPIIVGRYWGDTNRTRTQLDIEPLMSLADRNKMDDESSRE